jgi:hypothetical protein
MDFTILRFGPHKFFGFALIIEYEKTGWCNQQ